MADDRADDKVVNLRRRLLGSAGQLNASPRPPSGRCRCRGPHLEQLVGQYSRRQLGAGVPVRGPTAPSRSRRAPGEEDGRPRSRAARPCSGRGRGVGLAATAQEMWTTGQVGVRMMPSRFSTFATTSLPRLDDVRASARTMTSSGPVTSSAGVAPLISAMAVGGLGGLPDVGLDQDLGLDDHHGTPRSSFEVLQNVCERQPTVPCRPRHREASPPQASASGRRLVGWGPCVSPADAKLADAGEFGLVEALAGLFEQGEHVLMGPSDDAAVLRIRDGHVVVSTDLMVEGRHFRRDSAWAEDVGHRAAAQNLSDVTRSAVARTRSRSAWPRRPTCRAVGAGLRPRVRRRCAPVGASVVGGDVPRRTRWSSP